MNVDCYFILYFSLNSFYLHFSAIWNMLKCNFVFCSMCLSTFSHDAVQILASPESIAGGAPNSKRENWETFCLICYVWFYKSPWLVKRISLICPDCWMQILAALHVFKCNRFRTPADRIKMLSPLETFIQTSVVFPCTNTILNPQRLGQSKITWYVSWA